VFAPVTRFFNQPTTIDYEALSAAHAATTAARKSGTAVPTAAHAGVLAGIPLSVCPVCYLRRTSASVALPGTDIELPQLEEEQRDNEDRVFLPAQTDCWGECKYCYYCIADELAQHAQRVAADPPADESGAKWTCLRCGGAVVRATRLGYVPGPYDTESEATTSENESELTKNKTEDEWEKVEAA
jgi:peroxin-2